MQEEKGTILFIMFGNQVKLIKIISTITELIIYFKI